MRQACRSIALALGVALTFSAVPALASGGGGGGGGKGGNKPLTIRYTGLVTAMVEAPEGVYVQIGTSYYNTGIVLVTSESRVKLNGQSDASIYDVWLGDTIQADAYWPSLIVEKAEVIGVR